MTVCRLDHAVLAGTETFRYCETHVARFAFELVQAIPLPCRSVAAYFFFLFYRCNRGTGNVLVVKEAESGQKARQELNPVSLFFTMTSDHQVDCVIT